MVCCVGLCSGQNGHVVARLGRSRNHSRDRHVSTFDGAEWDVFRSAMAGLVGACPGKESLSRGRHGCVFDDAERDGVWSAMACSDLFRRVLLLQVVASFVEAGPIMEPLSRSASVRLRVSRSGMDQGGASWGTSGSGDVRCGVLQKPPTRSAWSRLRCCKVGWNQVPARHVMACLVLVGSVTVSHGNHHRVGTEADQRGRGGMCFGKTWSVRLLRGNAGCV
jgi:hypothetical protein